MQTSASGVGCEATPVLLRQRLIVEELLRQRRFADHQRYTETFRRAAIDPNPHQVEAVAFALERIESGGVLLCDEVGLGKTIETGLLLTQLRAEGKDHALIIVPVPLIRQWQVELRTLFGLKSIVLSRDNLGAMYRRGIYIVGREFAGTPGRALKLEEQGPWDVVVVDEAHELLGSLYKRVDRATGAVDTNYNEGEARRAAVLHKLTRNTPTVLLTATPLQNSLFELWSLVHFVDEQGVVLGHFHQFAKLFCSTDGRTVKEGMEVELKQRLQAVLCRTLRAQAQPFLKTPFTARRCETINFKLEPIEQELYTRLSKWLSGPMAAFRPRHRKLMTLLLRRRMGSSVAALKSTLKRVRYRLECEPEDEQSWRADVDPMTVEADLSTLESLGRLCDEALLRPSNKLRRLWELLERIRQGAMPGVVTDKVVIFTESLKTLQHIVAFLESKGLEGQLTSFSGTNNSPEAEEALDRWYQEVGLHIDEEHRPQHSSAMRAALIHEFKTRTRILVSTESGAKGLNLQFCNCLVNYDLPWNPQRIEQRIGRIHRYGQKHDAIVVNFINLHNEGEQRVYEVLKNKLRLFDGLLGASDRVLGVVSPALNFESRVHDLLNACRTPEEQQQEFDRLELAIDEATRRLREGQVESAHRVISELDRDVQARLRLTAEALPLAMSRRDEALLKLLEVEHPIERLGASGGQLRFRWEDDIYHVGPVKKGEESLNRLDIDHSLIRSRIKASRTLSAGDSWTFLGRTQAVWCVYRLRIQGLEVEERLLVLGPDGQQGLDQALAQATDLWGEESPWDERELHDALARIKLEVEVSQRPGIERANKQLLHKTQDAQRFLRSEERELVQKLRSVERERVMARSVNDQRTATTRHRRLKKALEELRSTGKGRLKELQRQVMRERRELDRRRLVKVEPTRLFRIVQRPK